MKITVCIGSSCHLKGSRQIVAGLQKKISDEKLGDRISLKGSACMGNCGKGVCVKINDTIYSVSADTLDDFFENTVGNL